MRQLNRRALTSLVPILTLTLARDGYGQLCEVLEDQTVITGLGASTVNTVAIDGDVAIIGVPSHTPPGKAYVIELLKSSPPPTWGTPVEIQPKVSVAGDFFGQSIAMWGDLAIIGAPGSSAVPGAAYIFRNTDGTWIEEAKLVPLDSANNDKFGISVDIEGDIAVVGKLSPAPGIGVVFRNTGEKWELEQNLLPHDGDFGSVGQSISVSGNHILIGAPAKENPLIPGTGHAFMFQHNGSTWLEQSEIVASDGATGDRFGHSVAIQGNIAIIGAYAVDAGATNTGAAYYFSYDGSNWIESQKIIAPDSAQDDQFGRRVALDGNVLLIGAPQRDIQNASNHGGVYKYTLITGQWAHQYTLIGSKYGTVESLGQSIAMDDNTILVGAVELNQFEGGFDNAAYSYSLEPEDCNGNGIPDRCDGPDCDHDTVPDNCQNFVDCDGDGTPDMCQAQPAYSLDDGSMELALGAFSGPRDHIWFNQFSVAPSAQIITHIDILWPHGLAHDGHAATLVVYDDPNNDGHPGDVVYLTSFDTKTHLLAARVIDDEFTRIAIPPTYVGEIGDSFFVGVYAQLEIDFNSFAPAAIDNASPKGRSWLFHSQLGQGNLRSPTKMNLLHYQYNFMIRALALDCNGNGTWDQCDIDNGISADANANGIPDECEGSCAADIAPPQGDGAVDVDDLLNVINAWGVCEMGELCDADVAPPGPPQGDGQVNVDDLLFIINNWGPCI